MTSTNLPSLLTRVQAATGPDRELDADLYGKLIGLREYESVYKRLSDGDLCLRYFADPTGPTYNPLRRYTSSIDAALALVEKLLPGWMVRECFQGSDYWRLYLSSEDKGFSGYKRAFGDGKTFPLAILAALISASIEKEQP